MPRYGINVNYAPSPWENVMPSIGRAIDLYQQDQEAKRQEANTVAAQGGTPIGSPAPSRGQRAVSAIGGYFRRRILGQGDGTQGAPSIGDLQDPNGRLGVQVTPGSVAAQVPASPISGIAQQGQPGQAGQPSGAMPFQVGTPQTGGALPMPRRIGDAILNDPSQIRQRSSFFDEQPSRGPQRPAFDERPIVRSGAGNQPAPPPASASPASGSIGQALQPYTYTARGGQQYSIDPMRASNMARAAKRGEEQDALDIKSAEQTKTQNEQVQALIDAGMSPAVARAKVLNNVVKYDEQFGQPRKGAMSQQDRLALQDRIDARQKDAQKAALRLEGLRQQGRQGSREFQQLSIQLRAQQQDDANDRALLQADEAEAGRAEHAVTTLQTNPVVSATPTGQAAITQAQKDAAAARAKAAESRTRVAGKGTRPAPGSKQTINQAQYEAARKKINPATNKPYTDAEIEQYYTIHPTVKRR